MDIVSKVEKLIALSSSPNENEARNAAFMACRLMREHRLGPGAGRIVPPMPPPPKAKSRIILKSKYEGWCRVCMKRFKVGDYIAYAKNKGSIHESCWDGKE